MRKLALLLGAVVAVVAPATPALAAPITIDNPRLTLDELRPNHEDSPHAAVHFNVGSMAPESAARRAGGPPPPLCMVSVAIADPDGAFGVNAIVVPCADGPVDEGVADGNPLIPFHVGDNDEVIVTLTEIDLTSGAVLKAHTETLHLTAEAG